MNHHDPVVYLERIVASGKSDHRFNRFRPEQDVVFFPFLVRDKRFELVMHPVVELPGDRIFEKRKGPVAFFTGRQLALVHRDLAAVGTVYAAGEPPLGDG